MWDRPHSSPIERAGRWRPRRATLAWVIVACLLSVGCLGPTATLRFRPPSATDSVMPAIAEPERRALKPYVSRDLHGMPVDRLREALFGPPHETASLGRSDVWYYTFVRAPLGRQSVPDARHIGEFEPSYPNEFRLALTIKDNLVSNAQFLWFEKRPALAFEVEALLGRPDRRETTASGERFTYRFSCLTQQERPSGAVTYRLSNAMLVVPFAAEGNVAGADLIIADRTVLTVRPDGSTEDPSTGIVWNMRPNRGGSEVHAATPVDVIGTDVSRIATPGAVQAVFGWPTETVTGSTNSESLTFAVYPLERPQSVAARLVVTYGTSGGQIAVRNVGIHWQGGLPRDAANLKLHLGSPDRTVGSPAGLREQWIYDYRIAASPPLRGTLLPIVYGLRLTFTIRAGVEVTPTVEVERTSLTHRRAQTRR